MQDILDIAIIGGGPAGLAAGIYARRGGAKVTLFEEMFAGGQIVKTHQVDNYPGFSDSPDGFQLGSAFEAHASKLGLDIQYDSVTALDLTDDIKVITLSSGTVYAKNVILCMGATPRPLGVNGEQELIGRGVSYCATCDGAFFRDKAVAVIGGGDTAISDAIYLSAMCKKVYVIHRRNELRAGDSLQKSLFAKPNVEVLWSTTVDSILGKEQVTGLALNNRVTAEKSELLVDGVFVAVGVVPRTELVQGQLELMADGSIITDDHMQTSQRGVFAAGDIRNTPLRQVITACSDGAIAATRALEGC